VFPRISVDLIRDDPDDNIILECALAAGVKYIITGDPHLLKLVSFEKIKIISPATFVAEY
jgi:predicted nucleic acid-binding protein